jgi:hypothetical protein
MARRRYTLWGGQDGRDINLPDTRWETYVLASGHVQHIYSETVLLGVSAAVERRVRKLAGEGPIYCDATRHNPRVVGFCTGTEYL